MSLYIYFIFVVLFHTHIHTQKADRLGCDAVIVPTVDVLAVIEAVNCLIDAAEVRVLDLILAMDAMNAGSSIPAKSPGR
jgi:hypothetical protein